MTPSEIFLTIALDVIPQNEIEDILSEYGYTEKPSVSLLFKAFEEQGDEFMHEVGELCMQYSDSPLLAARFRQFAELNKMSSQQKEQLTEEQKQQRAQNGLDWFKAVSELLSTIIGGGAAWTAQANGTAASGYEAQVAALEAQAQAEKTRQYLILGGVGILALVLLSFMFFKMFGK